MDYVVNNLLTQKFDLKREGTVIGAIRSINNTLIESYSDLLDSVDQYLNSIDEKYKETSLGGLATNVLTC